MSDKPLISYVIPCYNAEVNLMDTFRSIYETHLSYSKMKKVDDFWDQIQIVLVDDGSTDATWDIMRYLRDEFPKNVRIIGLRANMGKGIARNEGNKLAEADIIAVLDADDWNFTDRSRYILDAFKNKLEADIFYSGFIGHHIYSNKEGHFGADSIDRKVLKAAGTFGICHSTVAYRKKAILEEPYSNDRDKDDWSMLWNFFSKGRVFTHLSKMLVVYRVREETLKTENDPENQKRIFDKKSKIMETYFNKAAA